MRSKQSKRNTDRPADTAAPARDRPRAKKRRANLLLAMVILAGVSLLLYPTVSNYVNVRHQSRVVSNYESDVAKLTQEDYTPILEAAKAYNALLADNPDRFLQTDEEAAEYRALLNATGSGIMGFILIDKIGVKLPIYHGTDDSVLQVGAGHLEGTSLPVGGVGTHCAISGHSGLPSAKLFTDIDQLEVGDQFSLYILNEVLVYEVDQILVVDPTDLSALDIDPNEDYCTLITCTPYGINSHRLMVRGVRVPGDDTVQYEMEQIATPTDRTVDYDAVPALVVIAALLLAIILLTAGLRRSGRRKRKDEFERSAKRRP